MLLRCGERREKKSPLLSGRGEKGARETAKVSGVSVSDGDCDVPNDRPISGRESNNASAPVK